MDVAAKPSAASATPATVARDKAAARRLLWGTIFLILAAAFFACDMAAHPIVLWDESRLAVNAEEMSLKGLSLVTTYGFRPDLWNTKPPLLIWLQVGAIRLFGPGEWALRLPTLVAATGTVALVMGFGWRLTHSTLAALTAGLLLTFSPGFFGKHVVESGDYDALLTFFTTAYVLLLFAVVQRRRPPPAWMLGCGALVAGACLTKGVAGLIPGVGVFTYALASRRLPRLLSNAWLWLAGAVFVVLVGGFYLAREYAAPGYLAAVAANELGGRYLHGMPGHAGPPLYYLSEVPFAFAFAPGLLLLLAAPWMRWQGDRRAAFLIYLAHVVVAFIVVHSLSLTKIYWYMAPVYPLLALGVGIATARLAELLDMAAPGSLGRALYNIRFAALAILAAVIAATGLYYKLHELPDQQIIPQDRYGQVFAQLDKAGFRRLRVIDEGDDNSEGMADYTPQLRFYYLVWSRRGMLIRTDSAADLENARAGEVTVTCDPRVLGQVAALGRVLTSVPDCAAAAPRG